MSDEINNEPMPVMVSYLVGLSAGEVIDRYIIWKLKEQFAAPAKLPALRMQLKPLQRLAEALESIAVAQGSGAAYKAAYEDLQVANTKLWNIEDNIRVLETLKQFNDVFISLARSVYLTNDQRSEAKARINALFQSQEEVKVYRRDTADYTP